MIPSLLQILVGVVSSIDIKNTNNEYVHCSYMLGNWDIVSSIAFLVYYRKLYYFGPTYHEHF